MTVRDLIWDSVIRLLTTGGPRCVEDDPWWHPESEFCHWCVRMASDELDRSNKRTIQRTLDAMVEFGLLEKVDRRHDWDDLIDKQPITYTPTDLAKSRFTLHGDYQADTQHA